MPTKKEIAQELFQNWAPIEEIIDRAGDGTGTYEELRLFLASTAKSTYEELRAQHKQLVDLKSEIEKTETTLTKNKSEISILDKKIETKKEEQSRLTSLNTELKKRNQELNNNNNELIEKGVDDETIKKIRTFDHKDKAELLQRIDTINKYSKLIEEINIQQNTLNNTINENEKSRTEQKNLKDEITELNTEIEKLGGDLEKVGNIAEISELAVTYGYSPKALEALMKTIQNYLDITPYTTNTRVFEVIQEYQSLQQIKEATTKATRENETIQTQLLQSKGELNAIKDAVIKTIQETANKSSEIIQAQKRDASIKLQNLQEQQGNILANSEKEEYQSSGKTSR